MSFDVILYGVYSLDIIKVMHLTNQPWLELSRTPFAVNIGILGVFVVAFMRQEKVRSGLIGMGIACLLFMTGVIFTAVFLLAAVFLYQVARLLHAWAVRRGKPGVPYLVGWLIVVPLYFPLFFVTLPPFEGFMSWGEIVLFWGPAFFVFRSLHYIHMACKQRLDPNADDGFQRFLLYLVHFPSFWFGPYQKFAQFDGEVDTCKQRQTPENRREGLKRIAIGCVKFLIIFHVMNVPFLYKFNYYGPFADSLFANAESADPAHLWLMITLFSLRIPLFISALSDGVIGMNLLMGIRVPENSNHPLLSRDIQEFWKRWHVQANVFLRDDVFFPVGGLRHRIRGFLCVFCFSGFWHFPSPSAVLAFPLLHLILFELTRMWHEFWKRHEKRNDRIHMMGKRFLIYDSWLSGAVGIVFVILINALSVIFVHDHFFGGSTIIPRMFGF